MNGKMVRYILGRMLGVEALLLLLPAFVGILYGEEKEALTFVIPAVILTCIFVIAGRKRPEGQVIYGKEGMVVVASAWITWSLFGALPFTLSGSIPNFVDAFFETVSGFTTTGSSILRDVEALPQCMLFWRSFTHWIGGMGVLVFVLMLTNLDKKNSMYLMRAEVPGPEKDKLVPKTKTTARILYGIYFGLTMILVILLMFGGMNLFDSLIHAFGSAGTGGFSNYADSVGHFDSAYIDYVISIFMILFGINFNLYYFMLLGDFKAFWKNEELRVYLGIVATATILITLNTNQMYGSIMKAFRYALFQVSTIITTTGYATTDFNLWPTFSQCIVVLLMIIGACASSTGGGIKVSRLMIVFKGVKREIKQLVHPKSVNLIVKDCILYRYACRTSGNLPVPYFPYYVCMEEKILKGESYENKDKRFNSPDCGNRCSNLLLCDYTGNQHSLYRYVGSSIISNRNSFNCETLFLWIQKSCENSYQRFERE